MIHGDAATAENIFSAPVGSPFGYAFGMGVSKGV